MAGPEISLKIKDNFTDSAKRGEMLSKSISGITSSIATTTKAVLGLGAAYAGIVTIATKANAIQVRNEIALAHALGVTHDSLKTINSDLLEFAGNLQDISGIGDEETLKTMTRIAAATDKAGEEQKQLAKEGAKAAAIIGVLSGKGLEFGTEAVARSLTGSALRLAQFAPEIGKLTKEQAIAGDQIGIINERYGELLEKVGKLDPVARIMGRLADATEAVGAVVATSLEPAFDFIEEKFKGLSGLISENATQVSQSFLDVGKFLIAFSQVAITSLSSILPVISRVAAGLDLIFTTLGTTETALQSVSSELRGDQDRAESLRAEARQSVFNSADRGSSTIETSERLSNLLDSLNVSLGNLNNSLQANATAGGA